MIKTLILTDRLSPVYTMRLLLNKIGGFLSDMLANKNRTVWTSVQQCRTLFTNVVECSRMFKHAPISMDVHEHECCSTKVASCRRALMSLLSYISSWARCPWPQRQRNRRTGALALPILSGAGQLGAVFAFTHCLPAKKSHRFPSAVPVFSRYLIFYPQLEVLHVFALGLNIFSKAGYFNRVRSCPSCRNWATSLPSLTRPLFGSN